MTIDSDAVSTTGGYRHAGARASAVSGGEGYRTRFHVLDSDFMPRPAQPSILPELVIWYQTCLGRTKHCVVGQV